MHFEAKKRIAYSVRFTLFVRTQDRIKTTPKRPLHIGTNCIPNNSEFGAKEVILILS